METVQTKWRIREASRGTPWFEEFFAGLYGRVLAGQFPPARSVQQARTIRRVLRLRRGQRVLDCPCGQGRITLPLAEMGLAMTGVDLSAAFLRRARAAARRAGLNVRFLRRDMRKFDFAGEFDAAVNWFTSFGYFDEAGNLAAAKAAFAALKPGGRFLVEVQNKSWLVRHLHVGHDETIHGVRIVNRPRWNARTSRMRDTWIMSQGGRTERRRLSLRVYSGGEMRALLKKAGFADIRLFGHSRGGVQRLKRHSPRFIAVARKPMGADNV